MLSSAFLLHLKNKKENYDGNQAVDTGAVRAVVIIFVLLVLIDIAVLIYALSCLFSTNLPWYVKAIIVFFMLNPAIGILVSIGVIIYYHSNKKAVSKPVGSGVPAGFYFF